MLRRWNPAVIVSSPECRAHQTAAFIADPRGIPIITDDDVREHERASAGFLTGIDFVLGIERLLRSSQELVFGDETADAVFLRFDRAIAHAREAAPGRDQLIVSHGTAIAIYVGRTLGVDPVALWHGLRTPTALCLSADGAIETLAPFGARAR